MVIREAAAICRVSEALGATQHSISISGLSLICTFREAVAA